MSADFSLFDEVTTGLEKNSVGWENSVQSLQLACTHFQSEEAQRFLSNCLHLIVGILLDQHPGRIDHHQRGCIERSLHFAVLILCKLLSKGEDAYIPTVVLLFNKRKTFFKGGSVNYWSSMPGAPEIRTKCIQSFAGQNGFDELGNLLHVKNIPWLGADQARVLLQAAVDARGVLKSEEMVEDICTSVMNPIRSLTEEELKKESTEAMSSLISLIRRIAEAEDQESFMEFWLALTLTYIRSSSLPLRLFAWDQMTDLIESARKARPPAKRFLVKGAGAPCVNGIYEFVRKRNDSFEYQHACEDGMVLTLFRCQMRSRAKWWFISVADKDSPGTDKDVDYYQHRSTISEEHEPNPTGWITCSAQSAKGKDPPPTLERLEPLCPPGKENSSLEHQLMRWVVNNTIVEDVFGPSMHREIVNRSGVVLKFLSGMKALKQSHLDMIWKASVGQTEAELVEEIHTVLAGLIPSLIPDLAIHLFEIIRGSLKDAFAEGLSLVEKLTTLNMQEVGQLQGEPVLDSILLLLWDVLQHPSLRQHKAYSTVSDLFAQALKSTSSHDKQYAFLGQCLHMIQRSRDFQLQAPSPSPIQGQPYVQQLPPSPHGSSGDFDEAETMNSLRMAQFMLEVLPQDERATTLVQMAQQRHLPDLLFTELVAFKNRSNFRAAAGRPGPNGLLHEGIKLRLDVLRYVHSSSEAVRLRFEQLQGIWAVLDSPMEKELFLMFLAQSCNSKDNILVPVAFPTDVMEAAFRDIICQRADWKALGDQAYICFSSYFGSLRKLEANDVMTVGLDALWRIALTARTQSVAEAATRDLLSVYGEGGVDGSDVGSKRLHFLKRIFEHLAGCRDELCNSNGGGQNAVAGGETSLKAERCLRLIQGAVGSSGGIGGQALAHGVRGQAGRRVIRIEPKKILPQGVSSVRSGVQKLDTFPLSMHPLETIGVLRQRVAVRFDHPVHFVKLMIGGKPLNKDEVQVATLNLADGADIQAILVNKPTLVGQQQQSQTSLPQIFPPAPLPPPAAAGASNGTNPEDPAPMVVASSSDQSAGESTEPLSPATPTAVGDLIAQEEGYCHILFGLLECPHAETTFAPVIWELLLAIPTQGHALELVKLAASSSTIGGNAVDGNGMIAASHPQWCNVITGNAWHRSVYYLQIIDTLLQPADDLVTGESVGIKPQDFKVAFLRTGGFTHVLEVFMQTGGDSIIQGMATAVALRIVKFLLFGETGAVGGRRGVGTGISPRSAAGVDGHMPIDGAGGGDALPQQRAPATEEDTASISPGEVLGGPKKLRLLLNRLVQVAAQTHALIGTLNETWEVTVDALATIVMLLRHDSQGDLVSALVSNPTTEGLVVSVLLRNPHVKVRQQMRELVLSASAPDLGQNVFRWSLAALERLEPDCQTCQEFFDVLQELSKRHGAVNGGSSSTIQQQQDNASVAGGATNNNADNLHALARLVTSRLSSFPRAREAGDQRQQVLQGYLRLVKELVLMDHRGTLLVGTQLEDLIGKAFSDMLFAVPSLAAKDNRPICAPADTASRQLVFLTLLARVSKSHQELRNLVGHVIAFTKAGAEGLKYRWNYECSYDAKASPSQYVGLRNQGCTCYMNSLLQQLFMVPQLRDAVLAARVKRRRVIPGSQVSDAELVGQRILIKSESGYQSEAMVHAYDPRGGTHTIKYDSAPNDEVILNLREGRPGRETGEFDVIPPAKGPSPRAVQELEQTQKLLEQVQRTFCYLQSSEKRYFDPRSLVEVCKCLNLNYSVYQQNDASEFCDKLLDKLEAALKGGPQMADLQTCFGGKLVNQKIPQGCDHRAEKEEPFIKIELIIRGKESIQESLASFVEGEMMDGENKVECEGCNTKKATIRRTCLSQLPNVLILHLKRFDLDFSTFETVKLNNRCAFPMRLNVKPYTREGIEEAARLKQAEEDESAAAAGAGGGDGNVSPPSPPLSASSMAPAVTTNDAGAVPMVCDDGEYEYELKGVVIHAGVAQGGHYYSYIKDRHREDTWYKFDDEEVTNFDPLHIEASCFGGTFSKTTTWNGVSNTIEQERVSNALMLFYEKIRPRVVVPLEEQASGQTTQGDGSATSSSAAAATVPPVSVTSKASEGSGNGMEEAGAPSGEEQKETDTDQMDVGTGGAGDASTTSSSTAEGGGSTAAREVEEEAANAEAENFEYGLDGRSAFEEEVWKANVAFIYHSYLFDPQFHSFLSGVLSLLYQHYRLPRIGGGGGEEGGPPQQQIDVAGEGGGQEAAPSPPPTPSKATPFVVSLGMGIDALLANPGPPTWDASDPSLGALRLDVLCMGLLFLFDVILHSRERPGIHTWLSHIRQAFRVDPAAAPWFADLLTGPNGSHWLRTYFLECADATARGFVQQLVVSAVAEVAAREEEMVILRNEKLKAEDAIKAGSKVALLLHPLIVFFDEANKYWRHVDELFSLFREVAKASEVVRDYLVRCDLVFRLVMFVVGERAPPALRNLLPPQWGSETSHHSPDFLYLLEAVTTLVGVPQMQKISLLQDPGPDHVYTSDYKLTPEAKEALTEIFEDNCRGNAMGMQDIMKYLERCNSSPHQVSQFQIKNMLAKYETTSDGRLTLNGFLTYYRDTAVYSAKQVWQDLHTFGYRNDLTRSRATVNYHLGLMDVSMLPVPLKLPTNSQLALGLMSFYLSMFACSPIETTATLLRVSTSNLELSNIILSQALNEIHNIVANWNYGQQFPPTLMQSINIITTLCSINDAFSTHRCDKVFWDEQVGLCSTAIRKVNHTTQPQQGQTQATIFQLQNEVRYFFVPVLREIFSGCQPARQYVETRRNDYTFLIQWVQQQEQQQQQPEPYGPGGGGGYSSTYSPRRGGGGSGMAESEDDSMSEDDEIRVTGAGIPQVNGLYRWSCRYEGVGLYEHTIPVQHNRRYALYRCRLESREYRWYISILPPHRNPGTTDDIDYYYAPSRHNQTNGSSEHYPPKIGWKNVHEQFGPPPKLEYFFAPAPEEEDESDDDLVDDTGSNVAAGNGLSPTASEVTTANTSPSHRPLDTADDYPGEGVEEEEGGGEGIGGPADGGEGGGDGGGGGGGGSAAYL